MKQQTLTGFEKYGKTTRRAQFLHEMDQVVPWRELAAVVEPVYPKVSDQGGRPQGWLRFLRQISLRDKWICQGGCDDSLFVFGLRQSSSPPRGLQPRRGGRSTLLPRSEKSDFI